MTDDLRYGAVRPGDLGRPLLFTASEKISLRDWFAGQALSGVIIACAQDPLPPGCSRYEYFASEAGKIADAMLAARKAGDA